MSVHDHRHFRPAPGSQPLRSAVSPWLRWITSSVWWIEHAFERARADARPEEDTRVRIFLVMAVFSVVFCGLVLGAAHAALLTPKGGVGSITNPDALSRADLVDRNGVLLASNVTHYGLYVNPAEVWDRAQAARQLRRALPRIPAARLNAVLYGPKRALVLKTLTPTERRAVHALALGGISFEPEDQRIYPMDQSATFVIGKADSGGRGMSGAEKAFNDEIRTAGAESRDFALSIDLRVQGVLETELYAAARANGSKGAVGIVTDTRTGEVLGMASYPLNGPNNAIASLYEMGSVFKTFTIAAALDTGAADMNTKLDASKGYRVAGGRVITDFHATNRVLSLEEVYLHSSNIGTSILSIRMGQKTMQNYFTRLGLLAPAQIELQAQKPLTPREWSDSTLASLSFGYGISITPAQMSAAMGALTNGGLYVPLSLRKGGAPNVVPHRVVSEQTSLALLDLMRRNVVNGSGQSANAPGLRVGGKTGSSNKSGKGGYSSNAVGSFAAVFPADGPVGTHRYAIFVLMDEPQTYPRTGGFVAAPAVGKIAARIAPFLGVQRAADTWSDALGVKVPAFQDVEGDGR